MKKIVLIIIALIIYNFSTMAQGKVFPSSKRINIARISMHFINANPGDTIFCQINYFALKNGLKIDPSTYYVTLDNHNNASLRVELAEKYAYLYLGRDFQEKWGYYSPLIDNYLIKSTDNININIKYESIHPPHYKQLTEGIGAASSGGTPAPNDKHSIEFSGKGSDKFKCYYTYENGVTYENDSLYKLLCEKEIPYFNTDGSLNLNNKDVQLTKYRISATLNKYGKNFSKMDRAIFKADMIGEAALNRQASIFDYQSLSTSTDSTRFKNSKDFEYRKVFSDLSIDIPAEARNISKNYTDGIFNDERDRFFSKQEKAYQVYKEIKESYTGEIRDKLLSLYFKSFFTRILNIDSLANDALSVITSDYYKGELKRVLVRTKGTMAYDFKLKRTDGSFVLLSDFKGKVVFVDFYYWGCHACSGFYRDALKEVEEHFKGSKNVEFLIVCCDASKESWEKCIESGVYTSKDNENLINLYTNGEGFKHPVVNWYQIGGYPCPILIDKNGKILEFDLHADRYKEHLTANITKAIEE